jgi:hypothetical protein
LTLWKGRLSFKHSIALKDNSGIKMYELCESICSYVSFFLVCSGQGMELKNQSVTAETNKTAATAVEHHCGHGYTVWINNFYNSPALAQLTTFQDWAIPHQINTEKTFLT